MQDQNQISLEPQAPAPAKIVDVVAQSKPVETPAASLSVSDPELVSEPAIEPAPTPAPVEAPKEASIAQPTSKEVVKKQKANVRLATPAQPKQPSTVPVGAIIIAIIMFFALAVVALIAFRQGF